ncbi:hypothetical protein Hsw_3000 [Hymenobacter swuensis DY53]|uniref:Uncharacterized protein n=1 Tax=Hymenobacter swuensis DY53 TaxID=1227739 RepID=W8FA65_9BACT|nr:hypothetical protein Hsw_3000 [Hymenobacter swuensis DY53]
MIKPLHWSLRNFSNNSVIVSICSIILFDSLAWPLLTEA